MNQKVFTVMLLLLTAISLIKIIFIEEWTLVLGGLIFSSISFVSACILLLKRYKKQSFISFEEL
ncbi:MAG: hypothetical protein WCH78_06875 [Bacteroidota bacterium]